MKALKYSPLILALLLLGGWALAETFTDGKLLINETDPTVTPVVATVVTNTFSFGLSDTNAFIVDFGPYLTKGQTIQSLTAWTHGGTRDFTIAHRNFDSASVAGDTNISPYAASSISSTPAISNLNYDVSMNSVLLADISAGSGTNLTIVVRSVDQ